MPIQASSYVVAVASTLGVLGIFLYSRIGLVVAELILIVPFSWLAFQMFSSRARLEANLSEPPEDLDDLAAVLKRRAILATGALIAGAGAVQAGRLYWSSPVLWAVSFSTAVTVVVIGMDLFDQYRFQRRHGQASLLVQLDNVYFSYFLEERLQEAEIPALARGHHFRSLTFFFGALYKIDVFVPTGQLDQARGVLAELEMAREVRAF